MSDSTGTTQAFLDWIEGVLSTGGEWTDPPDLVDADAVLATALADSDARVEQELDLYSMYLGDFPDEMQVLLQVWKERTRAEESSRHLLLRVLMSFPNTDGDVQRIIARTFHDDPLRLTLDYANLAPHYLSSVWPAHVLEHLPGLIGLEVILGKRVTQADAGIFFDKIATNVTEDKHKRLVDVILTHRGEGTERVHHHNPTLQALVQSNQNKQTS